MGSLEERLRRLEERLIRQPSVDEYLDASNRERVRSLHALAERLAPYGFDGDYLFTERDRLMLAEDTTERRERDQETVEGWCRAQGRDSAAEVEGAKEKLLARSSEPAVSSSRVGEHIEALEAKVRKRRSWSSSSPRWKREDMIALRAGRR